MNNETVGVSAEIAIADIFNVKISEKYRTRGNSEISKVLEYSVFELFKNEDIPKPIAHIAENQNKIDFILKGNKTLSVKTNRGPLGKVAPQIIGQPTSETYFNFLKETFHYDVLTTLKKQGLEDNYKNRTILFKEFSVNHITKILSEYWHHIFECDYYIHFYNIIDKNGNISKDIKSLVLKNIPQNPIWNIDHISFNKTPKDWNESNIVKYFDISLGEFQAHTNRNCLKFRFNLKGILKLLENNLITE